MTPTWLATWPADNPTIFSMIVIGILVASVVILHLTLHEKLATAAAAILIPVAVTVILSHVLALSRDKDGRRWTLKQDHVRRLKPVLIADADALAEVALRTETQGAPRLSQAHNPGSTRNEMEARFAPDPLTGDIKNHYGTYAENRTNLRKQVEDQDNEELQLISRIMKVVELPAVHPYREHVARSFIAKCLGIGPGMTFTGDDKNYSYSWLGGGANGVGPAPAQVVEAFQAFRSFRPDADVAGHCANLKARRTVIIRDAKKLSAEARMLAERTTLVGDCEYTRLE